MCSFGSVGKRRGMWTFARRRIGSATGYPLKLMRMRLALG